MVKRSLAQSQRAPRRRSWRVIAPPLSRLPLPDLGDEVLAADSRCACSWRSSSWRSTTIWVAMPAWSVPTTHSASLPCMPRVADEDVLQRVVERMADVQRAGDVGRRHDDGEGLGLGPLGAEQALRLPNGHTSAPRSGPGRTSWQARSSGALSACRAAASTVSRHASVASIQSGLPVAGSSR